MRLTYVFILALFGCASSSSSSSSGEQVGSGHGQCVQRTGSYRSSFVTRSGNCGTLPETIDNITAQPTTESQKAIGCTGAGITYTGDNCEVTFDNTCPNAGLEKGGKERLVGSSKWNTAGTYGVGTAQITLLGADEQVRCAGTYDVTIIRQ